MIFDERLLVCVQRIRVRCELCIGLLTQITDDLRAMEALPAPEPDRVIAHDGLFPFTGSDWEQLRTLFSGLLNLRSDPAIDSLFKAAQVRPLDMILRVMPDRFYSNEYTGSDPYAAVLYSRMRPRALVIRSLRYVINDDRRIIGRILSVPEIQALPDSETIDEKRIDVPPLTLGHVRVYYATISAILGGPFMEEPVAEAIDDACGGAELMVQ